MRKCIFLFIGLYLGLNSLDAQKFPSELWHEGFVVLVSEDTIRGLIKYDIDNDLIQIRLSDVVHTYSSRKLLFFEIFDKTTEVYRQFFSLPYSVNYNYRVPILFEVLMEGEITLLAREQIIQESMPQYYMYRPGGFYNRYRLAYDFYFANKKGEIEKFSTKRSDLLRIMKPYQSEIKQFIKKNRLKTDRRRDLMRITAHYNQLHLDKISRRNR